MKRVIATAEVLLLLSFVLPVLLVERPAAPAQEDVTQMLPATPTPAVTQQAEPPGEDALTTVRVLTQDGVVEEMTMADYLWSVVAAEMPAAFEVEALKAQTVTARTYTTWKIGAGEAKHPDADVCADINCCQAYINREDAAVNWGEAAKEYTEKIRSAVSDTDGQIITYEGQPIQAVFFSSANGSTEDAMAVWGNAVPYLVGVNSPEGEDVPNYYTEVAVSSEEFRTIFLGAYPGADLTGETSDWFQNRTLTASGRVESIEIGGIAVKGTQIRSLFGLRSASFTVETTEDQITFLVTGYGHGVGMSQYGANTLAQEGKTYEEILTWYYTGVEIG